MGRKTKTEPASTGSDETQREELGDRFVVPDYNNLTLEEAVCDLAAEFTGLAESVAGVLPPGRTLAVVLTHLENAFLQAKAGLEGMGAA